MYDLAEDYSLRLEAIAVAIQDAEVLQQYLEEEEDIYYETLKNGYEPYLEELQNEIAAKDPLQLVAFEEALLDERFEGLFLPRILGYSVLRGEINEYYKYVTQQEHFGNIVRAIAANSNFEQLRPRIGQSIQVGFALSSDIWVTSLIESIGSKQVRHFLLDQKKQENRMVDGRQRAYGRYARQFKDKNFLAADFPNKKEQLPFLTNALKQFLLFRVGKEFDNSSIIPPLHATAINESLANTHYLAIILTVYAAYFDVSEEQAKELTAVINRERKNGKTFENELFTLLLELKASREVPFGPDEERRLSQSIDKSIDDDLTRYFTLTDTIHNDGYVSTEVHEAISEEILIHDGLSDFNNNVRQTIYSYFSTFAEHIGVGGYGDWFELVNKQFPIYIKLFGNEAFTQQLKDLSLKYTRALIKAYPDKRGKHYREIKKTTMTTFQEWGFMSEKQLKEFFKTPRKKKTAE